MYIEGLTKRVAEELKISQEMSEEICRSQFKFIVEMIRQDKTINCIHLGKFHHNKRGEYYAGLAANIPGV